MWPLVRIVTLSVVTDINKWMHSANNFVFVLYNSEYIIQSMAGGLVTND